MKCAFSDTFNVLDQSGRNTVVFYKNVTHFLNLSGWPNAYRTATVFIIFQSVFFIFKPPELFENSRQTYGFVLVNFCQDSLTVFLSLAHSFFSLDPDREYKENNVRCKCFPPFSEWWQKNCKSFWFLKIQLVQLRMLRDRPLHCYIKPDALSISQLITTWNCTILQNEE